MFHKCLEILDFFDPSESLEETFTTMQTSIGKAYTKLITWKSLILLLVCPALVG